MNNIDMVHDLRELADSIPEDETVLLPAIKPGLWTDSTITCEFERVGIAHFLRFVADMIE